MLKNRADSSAGHILQHAFVSESWNKHTQLATGPDFCSFQHVPTRAHLDPQCEDGAHAAQGAGCDHPTKKPTQIDTNTAAQRLLL
jgi:hypothetical protein